MNSWNFLLKFYGTYNHQMDIYIYICVCVLRKWMFMCVFSALILTSKRPSLWKILNTHVQCELRGWAEKFIWWRRVCYWWLFCHCDSSTATPIEDMCELQERLRWKKPPLATFHESITVCLVIYKSFYLDVAQGRINGNSQRGSNSLMKVCSSCLLAITPPKALNLYQKMSFIGNQCRWPKSIK